MILFAIWKSIKLAASLTGVQGGVRGIAVAVSGLSVKMGVLKVASLGVMGVLQTIGLAVGVAFAAYHLTRWIAKITGVNKHIQNAMTWVAKLAKKFLGLNKQVEWLGEHTRAFNLRHQAFNKVLELTGEKVTRIGDAQKILYGEWKKTGTLGNQVLDDWIKKLAEENKWTGKKLKTSGEIKKDQDDMRAKLKNLFNATDDLSDATKDNIRAWKAWGKKATDLIKGVFDYVEDLKRSVGKWEIEFGVKLTKDFESRAKDGAEKLLEIENELYERTVVSKMTEVEQKLYANKKYFEGLKKSVEEEKLADKELYDSKVLSLEKYYDEQRTSLDKRITDAKREIGVYEEIQRAKLAIGAATSSWELAEIRETATARLNILKSTAASEIAESEARAQEKLASEKKAMDERAKAYGKTLANIGKTEQTLVEEIIAKNDNLVFDWKQTNQEIEADWIRGIGKILKGGGNLLTGLNNIFSSIVGMWIDKVVEKIGKKEGNVWDIIAQGFEGMKKSITGVVSGISGALKGLSSKLPGIFGKVTGVVGGLIGNLAGLAGPVGAFIGIASKIPGVSAVFNKVKGAVMGLASKIPIIGGLFKKSKTAAEKAAEAAAQYQKELEQIIDTQSRFGTMSEETAKNIHEASKEMEGFAAVSKYFGDVISDVGVSQENINGLWERAADILAHVKDGFLDVEEGAKALGESFTQLIEGAKEFGTEGSKAMRDFIAKVKESGIAVQEVTDYINDQLGIVKSSSMNAAQGLKAMADAIPYERLEKFKNKQEEITEALKKTKEGTAEYDLLTKKLAEVDAAMAKSTEGLAWRTEMLERQALSVFNAMIANGASYSEAMNSIRPTLDRIAEGHKLMGTTASEGMQELLRISEITEKHKELFSAIDGNLAVLNALANTNSLTQQTLSDAAGSAYNYYTNLTKAGLTSNQALAQMAPTLERLKFLAKEHGLAISDTTQALIDQAEEQGLLKEEQLSVQDAMLAGFGLIIQALGKDIPDAMKISIDKMKDLEHAVHGSGVTGAMDILKDKAGATFSLINAEATIITDTMGVLEAQLGTTGDVTKTMGDQIKETFGTMEEGIKSGIEGLGELQKGIRKGDWAIPLNFMTPKVPKTIHAQGGFEGEVKEAVQPFIAHKGEKVKIWTKNEVDAGGAGDINIEITPIVIDKGNEYIIEFMTKKIERGDVSMPAGSVNG